jgi:hypothetical protein
MSSTRRSPIESFADTKGEVTDAQTNSLWYKDAVIYQLHVRSFYLAFAFLPITIAGRLPL